MIQELKEKDKIMGVEVNASCPNAQVNMIPHEYLKELKKPIRLCDRKDSSFFFAVLLFEAHRYGCGYNTHK